MNDQLEADVYIKTLTVATNQFRIELEGTKSPRGLPFLICRVKAAFCLSKEKFKESVKWVDTGLALKYLLFGR
jgi:hypothetical protein